MKTAFIFAITMLLGYCGLSAQNATSVKQVSAQLEQADLFKRLNKFRNSFEDLNKETGLQLHDYQDYIRLNIAYNLVRDRYNGLISTVKTDLSNWQTIKRLLRQPEDFAAVYLANYQELENSYHNDYLPVFHKIVDRNQQNVPAKNLTPELVALGINVFHKIVELIQSRKEEKEMSLNAILGTINTYFYNKLIMKSWMELDIPFPTSSVPNDSEGSVNLPPDPGDSIENAYNDYAQRITPSAPLFEQLEGWLTFNQVDEQQNMQPMHFHSEIVKDIDVTGLNAGRGNLKVDHTKSVIFYCTASEAYEEGAQFQIKVYNSAGMYVFVLNSNNTVKFLYPYANETLQGCEQALGTGKDIDVLPASFVTGRDRNSVTTLPMPDCSTAPPTERYFTITGGGEFEKLCVLLTKSEIDLNTLAQSIESLGAFQIVAQAA